MDSGMEDSGFDSDQKSQNGGGEAKLKEPVSKATTYKAVKKASELQKRIEKQRQLARRGTPLAIDQQPRRSLLPKTRLSGAGNKNDATPLAADQQPLVTIVSDDSEDDFDSPILTRASSREIREQLIKDGYNLDLEPDDEDLDLIPPRPIHERCSCCNTVTTVTSCSVQ